MNNTSNIKRFEDLMNQVTREGKDALMDYIRNKSDFYTAPASTRFHLSTEGGLLQHSLNVYDSLQRKKDNATWGGILEAAGPDALIICPLLHDLCWPGYALAALPSASVLVFFAVLGSWRSSFFFWRFSWRLMLAMARAAVGSL